MGLPLADVQQPHGRSGAQRDVNIILRGRRSQAANLVGLRIVFVLKLAPRFEDLLTYGMDVDERERRAEMSFTGLDGLGSGPPR